MVRSPDAFLLLLLLGLSVWAARGLQRDSDGSWWVIQLQIILFCFLYLGLFPGGLSLSSSWGPLGEFAAPELSAGREGAQWCCSRALPNHRAGRLQYKGFYLIFCFIISRLEPRCFSLRLMELRFLTALAE